MRLSPLSEEARPTLISIYPQPVSTRTHSSPFSSLCFSGSSGLIILILLRFQLQALFVELPPNSPPKTRLSIVAPSCRTFCTPTAGEQSGVTELTVSNLGCRTFHFTFLSWATYILDLYWPSSYQKQLFLLFTLVIPYFQPRGGALATHGRVADQGIHHKCFGCICLDRLSQISNVTHDHSASSYRQNTLTM